MSVLRAESGSPHPSAMSSIPGSPRWVIVDLVLLDAACQLSASESSHSIRTATGIFTEIERQLQDHDSHLRRKSAFGAMVTRGASIRFVRSEQIVFPSDPAAREDCSGMVAGPAAAMVAEAVPNELEVPVRLGGNVTNGASGGAWSRSGEATPNGFDSEPWKRSGTSTPQRMRPTAPVPKISDFPKSSRPSLLPSSGIALLDALVNWWPACTPACTMAPQQRVESCATVWAFASVPPKEEAEQGIEFEAGLGGWPLCISQAFAAFPSLPEESCIGSLDWQHSLQSAGFRRCAVELDDAELVVVFAPQRRKAATTPSTPSDVGGGCGTPASTPAAAPGAAPVTPKFSDEAEDGPPVPLCNSRLTIPCSGVMSVKPWPLADTGMSARIRPVGESGTSVWQHWVEVVAVPSGMDHNTRLILALPSAALALRLHDALARPRAVISGARHLGRSRSGTGPGPRGAIRCELRIAAKVDLNAPGSTTNCAAVVRRGLCEACHVSSDRVRIRGVRDSQQAAPTADAETLARLLREPLEYRRAPPGTQVADEPPAEAPEAEGPVMTPPSFREQGLSQRGPCPGAVAPAIVESAPLSYVQDTSDMHKVSVGPAIVESAPLSYVEDMLISTAKLVPASPAMIMETDEGPNAGGFHDPEAPLHIEDELEASVSEASPVHQVCSAAEEPIFNRADDNVFPAAGTGEPEEPLSSDVNSPAAAG